MARSILDTHPIRWMMMNTFKHAPQAPFTMTEMLSLYFSRDLLRVLRGTPVYASIESLLAKIRKTILPETLVHLRKLEQSFYVAQKKQRDYGRYKAFLGTLMDATSQSKTIEIKYHPMHSDRTTVYFNISYFFIRQPVAEEEMLAFFRLRSLNFLKDLLVR